MNSEFKYHALLFLIICLISCSNDDDGSSTNPLPTPLPKTTIADWLEQHDEYDSLSLYLKKTGLYANLNGAGQYTLFATENKYFDGPTTAFFFKSQTYGSVSQFPLETLKDGLAGNIIPKRIMSADFQHNTYYSSLSNSAPNDELISIYIRRDSNLLINGHYKILEQDIALGNGVVHTIGGAIGPNSILDIIILDDRFSALESMINSRVELALFLEYIPGSVVNSPLTLFLPTDQAFQNYIDSDPNLNSVFDIDSLVLNDILNNHIVDGFNIQSDEFNFGGTRLNSFYGGELIPRGGNNNIQAISYKSSLANIIEKDIQAKNGVIHVIDKILWQ